jgi:hypothetical protein
MPKGDGVKNETAMQRAERMRGVALVVDEAELAKSAISAPSIDKIHNLLMNAGKGGRPPCFDSVETMAAEIEDYFASCMSPVYDKDGIVIGAKWMRKPTVGGLAIHLGVSRDTIWRYSTSDQFSDLIKKAKEIITNFTEEMLIEGKNPVGAINTLVNLRIGWVADEKTIKVEPVVPDTGTKSPEEIAAFLDERALPDADIIDAED